MTRRRRPSLTRAMFDIAALLAAIYSLGRRLEREERHLREWNEDERGRA
jgi:hypothetical protein